MQEHVSELVNVFYRGAAYDKKKRIIIENTNIFFDGCDIFDNATVKNATKHIKLHNKYFPKISEMYRQCQIEKKAIIEYVPDKILDADCVCNYHLFFVEKNIILSQLEIDLCICPNIQSLDNQDMTMLKKHALLSKAELNYTLCPFHRALYISKLNKESNEAIWIESYCKYKKR